MKCADPECSFETTVLSTRPGPDNTVRRRRECPKGHRFTTLETVEADRQTDAFVWDTPLFKEQSCASK